MSKWTHSICEQCWNERNPGRQAHTLVNRSGEESCCFCGKAHSSGIFVRQEPTGLKCNGVHPE